MKRVRCPKCDNYITFDEKQYQEGQSLVFECPECGKQFGIRIGVSKIHNTQKETNPEAEAEESECGHIIVIENMFHYKQVLPLRMGDNVIGRYQKGNPVNTPVETNDPSMDLTHCVINVSRDKKGRLKYVLRDGPSFTGTFVGDEILGDKEKRVIYDGTVFSCGATSIILKLSEDE